MHKLKHDIINALSGSQVSTERFVLISDIIDAYTNTKKEKEVAVKPTANRAGMLLAISDILECEICSDKDKLFGIRAVVAQPGRCK